MAVRTNRVPGEVVEAEDINAIAQLANSNEARVGDALAVADADATVAGYVNDPNSATSGALAVGVAGGIAPLDVDGDVVDVADRKMLAVADADAVVAGYVDNPGSNTNASLKAAYETKVERGLRTFHAAIGKRHDSPVRIMGLGHSFMEGEGATANNRRWWERFQALVRTRMPMLDGTAPAGRGFIPAFYKAPSLTDPAKTGSTTEVATLGPSGRTLYMPSGATLTYELMGTTVRVWFSGGTSTGTINVSIDGVAQTPIDTVRASNTDGLWAEFSLGASGAHTVVLTASGACYVTGVEEFDGNEAKGFQINELGHTGFKISDLLAIQAGGGGDVDQLWNFPAADLYIIEYGINEWTAGDVTPATFRTNLDSLVSKIRARAPLASILYIADYQDLGTYTYEWSEFVQVYHDKASTDDDSCVLDMTLRMPTASTASAGLGLSVSDGHPSNTGHLAYAEYVSNFITPR